MAAVKQKLNAWIKEKSIKKARVRAAEKGFRYVSHYLEDLIEKDYGVLK